MNKFSWLEAKTVDEAIAHTNATVSDALSKQTDDSAVIKSGGIELLDFMKEGLIRPAVVINIRNIPGLDQISFDKTEGMKIGANVTLSEMESNETIGMHYPALRDAVANAATPQLREISTLGGNIAQRTRCWYFRSIDHHCFRKGGATCFAQNGENQYHAVVNNGTCCSVHASSVATALLAFQATVEITAAGGQKKSVPIEEFFVAPFTDMRRENVLKSGEIITAVKIPAPGKNMKSAYIKQGERSSFDWALADVCVVAEVSGKRCKTAVIALGAAAPVPVRAKEAESFVAGNELTEAYAQQAGEVAMEKATPLAKNAYKVDLFKAIIKRALLQTV